MPGVGLLGLGVCLDDLVGKLANAPGLVGMKWIVTQSREQCRRYGEHAGFTTQFDAANVEQFATIVTDAIYRIVRWKRYRDVRKREHVRRPVDVNRLSNDLAVCTKRW